MSDADRPIVVSGGFDNLRCREIRFLQEAARLGPLHALLWSDALCRTMTGEVPRFPQAERLYYVQAIRYVTAVHVVDKLPSPDAPPAIANVTPAGWAVSQAQDNPAIQTSCADHDVPYYVLRDSQLAGYRDDDRQEAEPPLGRKKVIVTGCYDWFHTGHVRFFEEVSELGDLYVVVGHDANVRALKGEGHPMFSEDERRYIVGSIRYVTRALISTGHGWMDAEPEIERIKPDVYAVNEDGDKPEKRAFCAAHGLEYVVLKRLPKPGLPRRESTHLRGF